MIPNHSKYFLVFEHVHVCRECGRVGGNPAGSGLEAVCNG